MSAEAVAWTFRCSPYKGAQLAVHLAIADTVSDMHGDEFWMRQKELATKARTTRQTVNTVLADMLADGYLELIHESTGGANRYRFLMPDRPPVWLPAHRRVSTEPTPSTGVDDKRADTGVSPEPTGVSGEPTQNPKEPKADPKKNDLARDDAFECFYAVFPRHASKGDARRAWPAAVKAAGGDPQVIIDGAARYAEEMRGTEQRYVKYPGSWLRAEKWLDAPGANRRNGSSTNGTGQRRPIDTDRSGVSGEVLL